MMPNADLFAADINYTPSRAAYPTASGATLAATAGAMTDATSVVNTQTGVVGADIVTPTSGARSLAWWLGLFVLLGSLVFAARKMGGDEDFRNLKPTFYNFMAITLTSLVGIVGLKVIFSKYRMAGLSDVILAA